jgi:hypothetical protein
VKLFSVFLLPRVAGVIIKYIIEKGSACVEAFREITHIVSQFFGSRDASRQSKEVAFMEDMCVLVEDLEKHRLHHSTPTKHFVPALKPASGRKKNNDQENSAIFDILVHSAEGWAHGKLEEYLNTTTYNPATGYPITETEELNSTRLNNMSSFDNTEDNPLDFESYDDLHGDDDDEGLGSLGGGSEFCTGEAGL